MPIVSIPVVQTAKSEPLTSFEFQGLTLYELLKRFETRSYFHHGEDRYETMNELMMRLNIKKPYIVYRDRDKDTYSIDIDGLFVNLMIDELKFLSRNLDKSLIRLKNKRTQQLIKSSVATWVQTIKPYDFDIRNRTTKNYLNFTSVTVYSKLPLIRDTCGSSGRRHWHSRSKDKYMCDEHGCFYSSPTLLSLFQYTWYNLAISELRKGNLILF